MLIVVCVFFVSAVDFCINLFALFLLINIGHMILILEIIKQQGPISYRAA